MAAALDSMSNRQQVQQRDALEDRDLRGPPQDRSKSARLTSDQSKPRRRRTLQRHSVTFWPGFVRKAL
jgi:hypothetical protein